MRVLATASTVVLVLVLAAPCHAQSPLFTRPGDTAPTPSPSPQCAEPFRAATLTHAVAPQYPDSARKFGMGWFYVRVLVTVGPDGGVRAANISKSSGNMMSDLAALRAARASSYAPKVVNCVAVTGDYMFRAEFNPYTPSPSPTLQ